MQPHALGMSENSDTSEGQDSPVPRILTHRLLNSVVFLSSVVLCAPIAWQLTRVPRAPLVDLVGRDHVPQLEAGRCDALGVNVRVHYVPQGGVGADAALRVNPPRQSGAALRAGISSAIDAAALASELEGDLNTLGEHTVMYRASVDVASSVEPRATTSKESRRLMWAGRRARGVCVCGGGGAGGCR